MVQPLESSSPTTTATSPADGGSDDWALPLGCRASYSWASSLEERVGRKMTVISRALRSCPFTSRQAVKPNGILITTHTGICPIADPVRQVNGICPMTALDSFWTSARCFFAIQSPLPARLDLEPNDIYRKRAKYSLVGRA